MTLEWIRESPAVWDAGKARLVGGAPPGVFDDRYRQLQEGQLAPGQWWRIEEDGRVVGYGWLDVVWGDAEMLLTTDPAACGRGVGSAILDHLEREAAGLGLNHLYNVVRPTHPDGVTVTAWLKKRGFTASGDGSLRRIVPRRG